MMTNIGNSEHYLIMMIAFLQLGLSEPEMCSIAVNSKGSIGKWCISGIRRERLTTVHIGRWGCEDCSVQRTSRGIPVEWRTVTRFFMKGSNSEVIVLFESEKITNGALAATRKCVPLA